MIQTQYANEYPAFMSSYVPGVTPTVEVARVITALASEFVSFNLRLIDADRALSVVASENENRMDDGGKIISSAKAKVMTEASVEAADVNELKIHKENIRILIASLESLLKCLLDVPKA